MPFRCSIVTVKIFHLLYSRSFPNRTFASLFKQQECDDWNRLFGLAFMVFSGMRDLRVWSKLIGGVRMYLLKSMSVLPHRKGYRCICLQNVWPEGPTCHRMLKVLGRYDLVSQLSSSCRRLLLVSVNKRSFWFACSSNFLTLKQQFSSIVNLCMYKIYLQIWKYIYVLKMTSLEIRLWRAFKVLTELAQKGILKLF